MPQQFVCARIAGTSPMPVMYLTSLHGNKKESLIVYVTRSRIRALEDRCVYYWLLARAYKWECASSAECLDALTMKRYFWASSCPTGPGILLLLFGHCKAYPPFAVWPSFGCLAIARHCKSLCALICSPAHACTLLFNQHGLFYAV